MSSPEETPVGPVIRDLRRIDPATGQVRNPGQPSQGQAGAAQPGGGPRGPGKPSRPGRHAASKPGGGPGGEAGAPGKSGSQGPGSSPAAGQEPPAAGGAAPAGAQGAREAKEAKEEKTAAKEEKPGAAGQQLADRLAERTADLQRVTAEYANYRKRVERDRMVVREQAVANVLHELLTTLDTIGLAREHGELVGGFKSVADSLESATSKLGLVRFGEEGDRFDPRVHEAVAHSYSADVTEPTCVTIMQPGYKVGERILRAAMVAVAEPEEPAGPGGDSPGEAGQRPDAPGAAETQGDRETHDETHD